ncbi:MAG: hypothetical protein AB2658_12340 [Candidatus Thiodiazotropha endolucinida]
MNRGTDAAEALGVGPGLARIAADQDLFDTAPHLTGRPGLAHLAVIHLHIDAQVAFDAGYRVDSYTCCHDGISSGCCRVCFV